MKNILLALAFIFTASIGFSQQKETTFKKEGDLVKATYFHENGEISVQGFFKNKKLTGEWTRFDNQGNKVQIAFYKEGKKTGKWFVWDKDALKEINYNNNAIVSTHKWNTDSKVASNE